MNNGQKISRSWSNVETYFVAFLNSLQISHIQDCSRKLPDIISFLEELGRESGLVDCHFAKLPFLHRLLQDVFFDGLLGNEAVDRHVPGLTDLETISFPKKNVGFIVLWNICLKMSNYCNKIRSKNFKPSTFDVSRIYERYKFVLFRCNNQLMEIKRDLISQPLIHVEFFYVSKSSEPVLNSPRVRLTLSLAQNTEDRV